MTARVGLVVSVAGLVRMSTRTVPSWPGFCLFLGGWRRKKSVATFTMAGVIEGIEIH